MVVEGNLKTFIEEVHHYPLAFISFSKRRQSGMVHLVQFKYAMNVEICVECYSYLRSVTALFMGRFGRCYCSSHSYALSLSHTRTHSHSLTHALARTYTHKQVRLNQILLQRSSETAQVRKIYSFRMW